MSSATALDWFLFAVAGVVLPVWSFVASTRGRGIPRSERSFTPRYWLIVARSVLLCAFIVVAWGKVGRPLSTLGLDVPISLRGRVGLLIDVALVGYYLAVVQFRKRSRKDLAATRDRLRRLGSHDMLPQTPGEFAVFPIAAVAGSTCEELLYRGFLVGRLASSIGATAAVLLSSMFFGLGHLYQGWIGVARTLLIGAAFGVGFAFTHSLWWLVIAHSAANLSGLLLARRLRRELAEPVSA